MHVYMYLYIGLFAGSGEQPGWRCIYMYTSNAYIYLYGAFRGIVRGSKSDVVTVADTRIYIYICIHVYIIYIWFRV